MSDWDPLHISQFQQGGERVRVIDATLNFPFGTAYQKPAYFGDCLCEVILDDGRWIQTRRSCIRPVRLGVGACRVALTPPILPVRALADLARGASSIAELKGGAVEHHDYLFLVRKNVRKYSRIMELLRMKETLDKAKDEYRDPVVDPRLDGDN